MRMAYKKKTRAENQSKSSERDRRRKLQKIGARRDHACHVGTRRDCGRPENVTAPRGKKVASPTRERGRERAIFVEI